MKNKISKAKTWTEIKSLVSNSTPMDYETLMNGVFKPFITKGNTKFFTNIYPTTHRYVKGMSETNAADFVDFTTNYQSAIDSNPPSVGITDSGKTKVALYKSEGSSKTFITHDWCDKTTWFQESTKITEETLSLDTGTTYKSSTGKTHWIDLVHGKMYDEFNINSDEEYTVVITDDGVVQTVTTDYTIDFAAGSITLTSAPSGVVKATYYYAGSSVYSIIPESGKSLDLEHSEIQFASDAVIDSPICFQIWVYNPYDLPNKVKYRDTKYKNARDYVNSCNLGQGSIPAFADLLTPTIVFPFNYTTVKTIKSSDGAELRLCIDNDIELTGSFGTCTFYTLSENE